ncbi:MAG: hypothetical protein K2J15_07225 [Muribaculaceae bacterium]|nr:hypothetical protein [Muribaculaceae bacterium]
MKRSVVLSLFALPSMALCLSAQSDETRPNMIFEESQVHMSAPELRVFVTPQICDLEMIYPGKPREAHQQTFNIKSFDSLSEKELVNFQNRALYYFAQEHNADIIIEPIFNSRISEKNPKQLIVSVTGYPAKYVNFRPLGKDEKDMNMINVVYPAAFQTISK